MQRHHLRFSSKLATTAACVGAMWAAPVMAQQNVFSRSDSATNLWENNTNLPWYYQTSNNNQNRPDNGGRNDVFFGHNNNLAQDINTNTWYQLRTLTLQSTATSNRTFTPSGTAGISLTVGYTGESGTGAHTFNNQFGIDGSSVTFTNNGGLFTGAGTFFINSNTLTFTGSGNYAISGALTGTGGSLAKTGTGTLTISNANNNYTGATTVGSGTLQLAGGNDRLPVTTTLTLGSGSTTGALKLDSRSQTLAGLVISGTGGTFNVVVNDNATAAVLTLNITGGTNTFGGVLGRTSGSANENNFGVTKTGAGVLVTSAANRFTGTINVNAGRWIVSSFTPTADLDNSSSVNLGGGTLEVLIASGNTNTKSFSVPINVNAASTFVYTNLNAVDRPLTLQTGALTLGANLSLLNASTTTQNNFININRIITGAGRLIYDSSTEFTSLSDPLSGRRGQLTVGTLGNSSWSGGVTIARGQFTVNANTAGAAHIDALGNSSGSLEIGAGSSGALLSFNNVSGSSVTIPSAVVVQSGGFRAIRNGGDFATNITFTGNVTLNGDLTVAHEINADRFITFGGTIQGAGGLNITRNGAANGSRVRLTGATANTYTGITTVYGNGALQIGQDGHLGTPPGSPTPGRLVLDSGTLYSTADFTLNANRGIALGPNAGASAGTLDVAATRTLTYNGIIANNGSGTGQLIKAGSGTLSLGGANTYSGSTTVSGGVLLLENISGSATGSGSITVSAGATLGGNGRATGSAAIDGFLAPGASVGDIELGSLSMGSGSQFTLELDTVANTADAVITQGSVSITSGAKLQLSFVAVNPGAYANTFVIVNNRSAAATTGMFDTMPAAGGLLQYTVNYGVNWDGDGENNDITITFTSVPEPAMSGLLAATSLALRRRRR